MAINQVTTQGNITRDIDLTYAKTGTAIANFGIAINEVFKDASGNKVEKVHFVDCTAFGNTAENLAKYYRKGDELLSESKLCYEQWQTPEGQNRSKLKLIVERFHFVHSQKRDDAPATARPPQRSAAPAAAGGAADSLDDQKIPF